MNNKNKNNNPAAQQLGRFGIHLNFDSLNLKKKKANLKLTSQRKHASVSGYSPPNIRLPRFTIKMANYFKKCRGRAVKSTEFKLWCF